MPALKRTRLTASAWRKANWCINCVLMRVMERRERDIYIYIYIYIHIYKYIFRSNWRGLAPLGPSARPDKFINLASRGKSVSGI